MFSFRKQVLYPLNQSPLSNISWNMFTLNTLVEIILIFVIWKPMDCFTEFNMNQIILHVEEISQSFSLAQVKCR